MPFDPIYLLWAWFVFIGFGGQFVIRERAYRAVEKLRAEVRDQKALVLLLQNALKEKPPALEVLFASLPTPESILYGREAELRGAYRCEDWRSWGQEGGPLSAAFVAEGRMRVKIDEFCLESEYPGRFTFRGYRIGKWFLGTEKGVRFDPTF